MSGLSRWLFVIGLFFIYSQLSYADEYVNGYFRSDGTYVQGYYRSDPDGTVTNNYSYEGNVNPHTGEVGTNKYIHDETSPYFQGPDSNGNVGHSSDNSSDSDSDSGE